MKSRRRPFFRWTSLILQCLCALLAGLLIAAWARSYRPSPEGFQFYANRGRKTGEHVYQGRLWHLHQSHGEFVFNTAPIRLTENDFGHIVHTIESDYEGSDREELWGVKFVGNGWLAAGWDRKPSKHLVIYIPHWLPILILLFWPTLSFAKWIRRKKPIDGKVPCPECDYDLRATPGRCPECGWCEPPALQKVSTRTERM